MKKKLSHSHKNSYIPVIAEIGINHNGSFSRAIKMINEAKRCGADIVKFQIFIPEMVATKHAKKALYQINNPSDQELQIDMIKKYALNFSQFEKLKKYCDDCSMEFLASPFDLQSLNFLKKLKIKSLKIPSGEITNTPYLEYAKKLNFKKIFLSTGMSTEKEIHFAINQLKHNNLILLHCNTSYPVPYDEINLNYMTRMKKIFNKPVGFSDHSLGSMASVCALALGAQVIEKHFTLNNNLKGPDHKASLNPKTLKNFIKDLRQATIILGKSNKIISQTEFNNSSIARKSIVASTYIKKGDLFSKNNLTTKRPGNGVCPTKWNKIIGLKSNKNYKPDDLIKL